MTKQDIQFVIVTYEPEEKTLRRLIAALQRWPVVIVDNSETKTQKLKLKTQNYNSKLKYVQNEINNGYGAAANQGMKEAFEDGAKWMVVVNQDVVLSKTGVTKFVKALEHCGPGIVGPEAGNLDPLRWTTILNENEYKFHKVVPCGTARNDLGERAYISGAFMAVHRDVWEATGGFYEPYFMYYEDADLCVRARKAGYPLRQVEIEGFTHKAAKNVDKEGSIPGQARDDGIAKEYYLARNHLWFVLRNAPMSVKLYELFRFPKTVLELWL